jgi:hypothetical protein
MAKDAVFRMRMPSSALSALQRVAKDKGLPASEYARRMLAEEVGRDESARRVREALRKARRARLDDERALALADEAKHRSRSR